MEFLNENLSLPSHRPYCIRLSGGEFLLATVQDKEYNVIIVKMLLLSTLLNHSYFCPCHSVVSGFSLQVLR